MMNRFCFEAFHVNKPFGHKVFVLGGDFKQIFPVIKGMRQGNLVVVVNSFTIWSSCWVSRLTKNTRLIALHNSDNQEGVIFLFLFCIMDSKNWVWCF